MNVKYRMSFARADARGLREVAQQRVERLLFARADALGDRLGGVGGVDAQAAQNLGGHAAPVGEERGEEVVGLYLLAPLRPSAPQRPIEQIASRFGDAHLASHVNWAFGKFLFQQACD